MEKLTLASIFLAVAGVAWIAAEEISIQTYLNSPCPEGTACDNVVGRSQVPSGAILISAGGIVFVTGRIVRKPTPAPAT